MKIECSGCYAAEAKAFCCADEAALCLDCDQKIHAADKLVSKHQRVPLSSSPLPKCDICQETFGYFFCVEDRALLCRKCDVAIHTVNSRVAGHQRLLLTGVRVGLEAAQPQSQALHKIVTKELNPHSSSSTANQRLITSKPRSEKSSAAPSEVATSIPNKDHSNTTTNPVFEGARLRTPNVALVVPENATKDAADWRFKEFLELINPNHNIDPSTHQEPAGLSKAEGKGNIDNSEWLKILRSTEEELLNDKSPTADDMSWTVPQLLSKYPISGSPVPSLRPDSAGGISYNVNNALDYNNFPDSGSPAVDDSLFRHQSVSSKRRSRRRS